VPQVWVLSRDLPVLLFTTPMPDGRCYHATGLLDSYCLRVNPLSGFGDARLVPELGSGLFFPSTALCLETQAAGP